MSVYSGVCAACGRIEELRVGICFDCATSGEEGAAKRKSWQHLWQAWVLAWRGHKHLWKSKICIEWAWERTTKTGDYAPGGQFDFEGYDWR